MCPTGGEEGVGFLFYYALGPARGSVCVVEARLVFFLCSAPAVERFSRWNLALAAGAVRGEMGRREMESGDGDGGEG